MEEKHQVRSGDKNDRPWIERVYDASLSIDSLSFEMGAVFVTADIPVKAPTIILLTTAQTIADSLNVTESGRTLSLTWKVGISRLVGQYYIEIQVPPHSIASITSACSGIIAVYPKVLKQHSGVAIKSQGSARILIEDTDLQAEKLDLSLTGPGVLQVACTTATIAGALDVSSTGSGTLAFFASSLSASHTAVSATGSGKTHVLIKSTANITDSLDVKTTGSGAVVLNADALSTHDCSAAAFGSGVVEIGSESQFFASKLKAKVTGSGQIKCIGNGSSTKQKFEVTGSGSIHSSLDATADCVVKITGSGNVYLPPNQTFAPHTAGSGKVFPFQGVERSAVYTMCLMPVPAPHELDYIPVLGPVQWLSKTLFG
ncbi:hypothetical protein AeMF1_014985 [Aphanomyces euteiches]|nr:hypothetical protein AeMF1_014985 [Aphanomyces euteiches]KAH9187173.1 hypothetical protein AeNC1_010855 [Aphanomyces euteiches]